MDEMSKKIDQWTYTDIRDKKAIEFINNIKSLKLRSIIRNHFEYKCNMVNSYYSLKDFKEEFITYLNDKKSSYYFLPELNGHYEDILKKLLKIEKWNNEKEKEND